MKNLSLFLIALVLAVPLPAFAKKWTVDYAQSALTFTGTQTGKPFTGKFKSYFATVDFDPAKPEAAAIDVTIEMASAHTGDGQKDDALPQPEWFDAKAWPQAHFMVTKVEKKSATEFVAQARLTLKGQTKNVTLPFTMVAERDAIRAKGSVTINRSDFNVGTGDWASDQFVKKDVMVGIDLLAH